MKTLLIFAAALLLVASAAKKSNMGQFGFMPYDYVSDMSCFKARNFTYQNAILYMNGNFQYDGYYNTMNAYSYAITPHIIIAPNMTDDPKYIFQYISYYLTNDSFHGIQIYTGNLNSASQSMNCQKLQNIIQAWKYSQYSLNPISILTDAVNWYKNFGLACGKSYSMYNLTYINFDGQANFNDWSSFQFGDWSYPTEKIYDQPITCGEVIGSSYKEGY